jgi:hypothetical protein
MKLNDSASLKYQLETLNRLCRLTRRLESSPCSDRPIRQAQTVPTRAVIENDAIFIRELALRLARVWDDADPALSARTTSSSPSTAGAGDGAEPRPTVRGT